MAVQQVTAEELELLVHGGHGHPHAVLGPHVATTASSVRIFKPLAKTVRVAYDGEKGQETADLDHEYAGIWAGELPVNDVPDYRVTSTTARARSTDRRPLPLPAHARRDGPPPHQRGPARAAVDRARGAPPRVRRRHHAARRSPSGRRRPRACGIKGDFNSWDGREHPMRQLGASGIWELFVPDVGNGTKYKFLILGADGQWREKADPMAFHTETPPATSSVVFGSTYTWGDDEWMTHRGDKPAVHGPMSTYEMHLGSWKKHWGGDAYTYQQLADDLVPYLPDLGFTHVEFLPVMEHPYGGSWGYQVTSYFAPTARFGDPDGFRYLVDRLHQAGIGVIVDWVPAHFPKDTFALSRFDGTPLYEDPNPSRGEHPDWGTYVFNFGRREVRNFLVANALYWLEEYHIDGLRVDAVASMIYLDYSREAGEWQPNVHGGRENLEAVQFLQEMNATVYKRVPGAITIAEESTSWDGVTRPTESGGLGFGFKWNMGWMHDTLGYFQRQPVHRAWHHNELTFALVYAWAENFVLPISHDEVVHGKGSLLRKMPGDRWQQLANLRAFLAYMWAHPGKQLHLHGHRARPGVRVGRGPRARLVAARAPRAPRRARPGRDLNRAYVDSPAIWSRDDEPASFEWIDANDAGRNVFSFARHGSDGSPDLVCVANFAATPHGDYRLGLPAAGRWDEVVNTDAAAYAGSGVGNLGAIEAVEGEVDGQPAHATLVLPPLATVWFRKAAE